MPTRISADLFVSPAEDRAIKTAADRAGLSKRAWITQVVRDRIDQTDDTKRVEHLIERLDTETRARSAQTTAQTLEVIRLEAARLTDYVVDAMHQAMPKPEPVAAPEPTAEWGELVALLHKIAAKVAGRTQVDAALTEQAVKHIARCRTEYDAAQNNVKRVKEKESALIRALGQTDSVIPQLDDLFALLHPMTGIAYPK